jgi:hypothetical protein
MRRITTVVRHSWRLARAGVGLRTGGQGGCCVLLVHSFFIAATAVTARAHAFHRLLLLEGCFQMGRLVTMPKALAVGSVLQISQSCTCDCNMAAAVLYRRMVQQFDWSDSVYAFLHVLHGQLAKATHCDGHLKLRAPAGAYCRCTGPNEA